MAKFNDLTGRTFGLLTVLPGPSRKVGTDKRVRTFWKLQCACGNEDEAQSNVLTSNHKVSCGCRTGSPLPDGVAESRNRFRSYQAAAKARGFSWELSFDEFIAIGSQPCTYCLAPAPEKRMRPYLKGSFAFNGIDRVDSSRSYVLANCVACCSVCNRMKGTLSFDEFINQCRQIAQKADQCISITSLNPLPAMDLDDGQESGLQAVP